MLCNFMTNVGRHVRTYLQAGEVLPTSIRGQGAGFATAFAEVAASHQQSLPLYLSVFLAFLLSEEHANRISYRDNQGGVRVAPDQDCNRQIDAGDAQHAEDPEQCRGDTAEHDAGDDAECDP